MSRRLHEPRRDAFHEGRDVRLHRGRRHFIRLGENEDERHFVAREPLDEFDVNVLRLQAGFDERKDEAQVRAMFQVLRDGFVEALAVLLRPGREAIARQIHEPPGFVHLEDVDHLREPRPRRDARQALLAGEHVEQRGFADVRAADEGEFRQRLVWTRAQVRRAAMKDGG